MASHSQVSINIKFLYEVRKNEKLVGYEIAIR